MGNHLNYTEELQEKLRELSIQLKQAHEAAQEIRIILQSNQFEDPDGKRYYNVSEKTLFPKIHNLIVLTNQ